MTSLPPLPASVRSLIDPGRLVQKTLGRSGALVFDGGDRFLKIAPKGSLCRAAKMQKFFAAKGLSRPLLAFEQDDEHDFMLTAALPGRDAAGRDAAACLFDPELLSVRLGEAVRQLHETPAADCPLADANSLALDGFRRETGHPFEGEVRLLKNDTLIHGDCCLPNIFFDEGRFTGFTDLGDSGLGDRHFDLYSVCWSLEYNLKTARYTDILLDAYGRDAIDPARFDLCTRIARGVD